MHGGALWAPRVTEDVRPQEVYTEFSEACGGVIPPFSDVWARDAQARASKTLGMLERQLSNAHGMPKENTRVRPRDLGVMQWLAVCPCHAMPCHACVLFLCCAVLVAVSWD